jgi:ribosomal protein S18 acetylase RimI-like enzyme
VKRPSAVRILQKVELSPVEVTLARQLIDRANQAEGLDLPLDLTPESAAGGSRYSLAWDSDRLVGLLELQGRHEVEVCLAVAPEDRRRGIGRQLLESAKDLIRNESTAECLLVVDEASTAGRPFAVAMGARYHESEYRLILDERAVPTGREWPTPVTVRQGSADDVDLIARVIATSFDDAEAEVKAWVARMLPLPNHRFFIGSVDGEPIGNLRTNYYGTDIYVTTFGVLPDRRGRGFGRKMLLQTIDRLLVEKWPRVLIEVATDNPNALGLYESCGFRVTTTYGYYQLTV